eukprot:366058-Chlamydomonas_euryale.AAC.12
MTCGKTKLGAYHLSSRAMASLDACAKVHWRAPGWRRRTIRPTGWRCRTVRPTATDPQRSQQQKGDAWRRHVTTSGITPYLCSTRPFKGDY